MISTNPVIVHLVVLVVGQSLNKDRHESFHVLDEVFLHLISESTDRHKGFFLCHRLLILEHLHQDVHYAVGIGHNFLPKLQADNLQRRDEVGAPKLLEFKIIVYNSIYTV